MIILMSNKELANIYGVSIQYAEINRNALLRHYNDRIRKRLGPRHPEVLSNKSLDRILKGDY